MFDLLIASSSDAWDGSVFSGMESEERFGLMLAAVGCVTGIVISVAYFISSWTNSIHRRRIDAELKRDMLDRGMSADEIVKVIESSAPSEDVYARAVDAWGKRKK